MDVKTHKNNIILFKGSNRNNGAINKQNCSSIPMDHKISNIPPGEEVLNMFGKKVIDKNIPVKKS